MNSVDIISTICLGVVVVLWFVWMRMYRDLIECRQCEPSESSPDLKTPSTEPIIYKPRSKTVLVNLYGAPGAGKSTGAAFVYALLKMAGVNAELVTEFPKDLTWEHNEKALSNQIYVLGNQYYRITRCEDEVDVIVTDSPLQLSELYNKDEAIESSLSQLIYNATADRYDELNYYVTREKGYNPKGRNQTEAESNLIGDRCLDMLRYSETNFKTVNGNEEGYRSIFNDVINHLTDKQ